MLRHWRRIAFMTISPKRCRGIPLNIQSNWFCFKLIPNSRIIAAMRDMMADMAKANVRTDGLFLNADAGFDCAALRSFLKSHGVVANIRINKRNGTGNDSTVLDELLYRERYSIERTNEWMDSFRTILNRFDTTLRNWASWNYIAFSVMLLRKWVRKRKV